jgi:hypothetical protein
VRILEEFIHLELDEGKKLNTMLGLTFATLGTKSVVDPLSSLEKVNQVPLVQKLEPKKKGTKIADHTISYTSNKWKRTDTQRLIKQAADAANVSAAFVDAIAWVESRYNPAAISSKGAQGMMQFMPSTARDMGLKDPFDPTQAVPAAARYLKSLLDRYNGDYELAAAAYNAGPNNVDKYKGIPPFDETRNYVPAVMKKMKESIFADRSEKE